MNTPLAIHPELLSVKGRTLPLNRWALVPLQMLLSGVNALHRRKFKDIALRTKIPSFDGYPVPVAIIRAENLNTPAPALVYYHGGGFVLRPAPQHFENAVRYAREARCVVIFTEYRLAPQYPFPAGFNDCYAALGWTLSNAEQLGIDKARIVVGGDSAGGCMAAGVAQRALQEDGTPLCAQLLIYPCVDLLCTRPSISAYASVPPFKNASTVAIAEAYLGHAASQGMPRYASPLRDDVSGVAPAYVETSEFDLLHDQGIAYAQALIDKGVHVELNDIKGSIHGFDLMAAGSSVSGAAMQRRIEFLRHAFDNARAG